MAALLVYTLNNFIYTPPKTPFLDILYQDEDIIVVNKPSGLLSVPGRLEEHKDSIISRIWTINKNAMAVHRLDMDTSGIMVVGLSKTAISSLGRMFMQKAVKKLYLAIVEGNIQSEGEINLPIRCDIENRPLQIVDFEQGKESTTLYKRISNYLPCNEILNEFVSVVELTPVTGRSHQLRVHLASINHPILGDRFYADKKIQAKAQRLCLHAYHLEFNHPITGEHLVFSTVPEFLKALN